MKCPERIMWVIANHSSGGEIAERTNQKLSFHTFFFLSSSILSTPSPTHQLPPPQTVKMVKNKKAGETISSRLALVMKSGKGKLFVYSQL